MEKETIINYCSRCDNDNNHKIVFIETDSRRNHDYDCSVEYMILSCMGCGGFSFREDFNDHEQAFPLEDGTWDHPVKTTIYPPFLKNHKRLAHVWRLPESIQIVYQESIRALIADCRVLAGVGFRAVIEAICLEKEIKGRSLESKINNLSKEGFITKQECERLHSIRFLGNDSIHEMRVPEKGQLIVVLSIVEHVLKNLYIIDWDVDTNLERPINNYESFKKLLNRNLQEFKAGDEFPLVKFLGRDTRLVKDNFIDFETKLKEEIRNGDDQTLQTGVLQPFSGSTSSLQHYVVKLIPQFPF